MPMEIQSRVGNVTQPDAAEAYRAPAGDVRSASADAYGGLRALLVVAAIALGFHIFEGMNGDTSSLLTVGERWLAGLRPYVDAIEINPPMSVLLFLPAVWLGQLTGVKPEALVFVFVVAAALVAIETAVRALWRHGLVDSPARMRLALGFALLVLPLSTFAQREQFAVVALTPIWAVMRIRAARARPSAGLVVAAGLAAGLAIAIKPQFAAAVLLPALAVVRAERRFAALFVPEYWLAGCVVALYAASVYVFFRDYVTFALPLTLDVYRPVREPLSVLVFADAMPWLGLALVGLWVVARKRLDEPAIALPLLAAAGFLFALIEQGKGFAYHYYPVAAALMPALVDRGVALVNARLAAGTELPDRIVAVAGFLMGAIGVAFATLTFQGMAKPMAGLMPAIASVSPHPSIAAITPHAWIGNPLVRDVGGRWVGPTSHDWITLGALYKLGLGKAGEAEQRRLSALIDWDKEALAAAIARERPDIVLVEHDDHVLPAWFSSPAELRAFLSGYRPRFDYVGVEMWVRVDLGTALPAAPGR